MCCGHTCTLYYCFLYLVGALLCVNLHDAMVEWYVTIFLLTGLRICTGEYKAQGATEGRAL